MIRKISAIVYDNYVAIFGSPYSFFYPSPINIDGNDYISMLHYYIAEKARFFNDTETLDKIMSSTDINEIRKLEMEIKNYDDKKWAQEAAIDRMYKGTLAKFSQNDELKTLLFDEDFNDKTFAYASLTDRFWGTGIKFGDPKIDDKRHWLGLNIFGDVLTKVRNELL